VHSILVRIIVITNSPQNVDLLECSFSNPTLAPDAFAQVKKGLKNIFRRKKEKKAQQNSDAKPTETAATPAAVPEATPAQPAAPTEGTAPTPTPEATPAAPTEGTAPTPTPEATPAAPAESAPAETKPAVPTPAAGTDGAAGKITAHICRGS
jgi:hypothetical protein